MGKTLKTILSLICLLGVTQVCAADYHSPVVPQEVTLCAYPSTRHQPELLATPRQGFYIEGFGSANFLRYFKEKEKWPTLEDIKFKTGYVVGSSLGYSWGNGLRNEVELAYRRNPVDGANAYASSVTCMVNVLYDFNLSSLKPYIGLGAGYIQGTYGVKASTVTIGQKLSGPAGQIIAGVNYEIYDKTEIGIKYNYLMIGKAINEQSVSLTLKRFF